MNSETPGARIDSALPKARAVPRAVVMSAAVVVVALIFSAEDFFRKDRNAADQETMREMNQLCRNTLTPFDPRSPVGSLSKQTMENIELARKSYCAGTSRARSFDALSLYNLFGSASRAGVCRMTEATQRCLQYLDQRVAGRQQRLPADFEAKVNDIFSKMKIDARFNTSPPPSHPGTR